MLVNHRWIFAEHLAGDIVTRLACDNPAGFLCLSKTQVLFTLASGHISYSSRLEDISSGFLDQEVIKIFDCSVPPSKGGSRSAVRS